MAGMGMGRLAREAGVTQAPPAQGDESGEAPNVSPEDQAAYNLFVGNGMQLIFPSETKGDVNPAIMKSLQAADDPIQNLAMTAASLISGLIENAGQSGHQIDPDVIYQGGVELLENLADVMEAANIHDFSPKELESALYNAADIIIKNNPGGIIDPETAKQQFGEVIQADRDGSLEQAVPQIGQYNASETSAQGGN